ncbi:DUF6084 family protein [Streptomyces sp. NPDC051577]|uniref:DUF6084 family protein n=1 Tax=Streptomyces sp. NPDC051577 TaxID=3155166 RepID=UPI00342BD944
MTEFGFICTGVRADQYAAGPTLVFRLAITATEQTRIHALALRCQIRIEPARRGYGPVEAEGLADLFGERSRWGNTLLPVQFAQVTLMVPSFTGSTEIDLVVPCTYDMDIAASRYLGALEDGEAPLLMLFSGTAFTGAGGFHVEPVPWDREASYRMPVAVWQEMIEQHFPGCGWLRLPRDTMDELLAYRSRHALASWEATVRALLDAAAVPAAAADAKPSPQERFRAGALPPRTAQRTVAP